MSINYHGLMNIFIVGDPHQMIYHFSMFQGGKELENFPMGKKKYNEMVNTMKLMQRAVERCGKWDMEWPTNKNSVLYWSVCKYFGYPEAIEMRK